MLALKEPINKGHLDANQSTRLWLCVSGVRGNGYPKSRQKVATAALARPHNGYARSYQIVRCENGMLVDIDSPWRGPVSMLFVQANGPRPSSASKHNNGRKSNTSHYRERHRNEKHRNGCAGACPGALQQSHGLGWSTGLLSVSMLSYPVRRCRVRWTTFPKRWRRSHLPTGLTRMLIHVRAISRRYD
jgi:hypothetical protein